MNYSTPTAVSTINPAPKAQMRQLDEAEEVIVEEAIARANACAEREVAAPTPQPPADMSARPAWRDERRAQIAAYRERVERGKVEDALRRNHIAPADFYAKHPDFWRKSRSERDRILHTFITKAVNEREASARCKPVLSGAERTRRWRAKKAKPVRKPPLSGAERTRRWRARKGKAAVPDM